LELGVKRDVVRVLWPRSGVEMIVDPEKEKTPNNKTIISDTFLRLVFPDVNS
jgi:hypothetical protein